MKPAVGAVVRFFQTMELEGEGTIVGKMLRRLIRFDQRDPIMKRLLSCAALATLMLATAACTSSGGSSKMDTQSGGSNATAEKTEKGVPTLPAE